MRRMPPNKNARQSGGFNHALSKIIFPDAHLPPKPAGRHDVTAATTVNQSLNLLVSLGPEREKSIADKICQ
jgi:hypothetical protein